MRTLRHILYYPSRSVNFTHWHITDVHIGHAACDEAVLRADVKAIADDPYATWGGGGDYGDFIPRKGDKRYRESSIASWLRGKNDVSGRQRKRFLDIIEPIAHKCLYLLKGNHEDSLLTYYDSDQYREVVKGVVDMANARGHIMGKRLEMRDIALGWEGFVQLVFRRGDHKNYGGTRTLTIYAHHGAGGGRKQGGHALRLEEILGTYEADVAFYGHRHQRQVVNVRTVRPSGKGVTLHERLGIMCGSYLGAYIDEDDEGMPVDNYPQVKNLSPTSVGIVPIIIKPDLLRITPIVTNGIATELLRALNLGAAAA